MYDMYVDIKLRDECVLTFSYIVCINMYAMLCWMYVRINECLRVYTSMHFGVGIFVFMCMYVYTCIVCMCVCTYVLYHTCVLAWARCI